MPTIYSFGALHDAMRRGAEEYLRQQQEKTGGWRAGWWHGPSGIRRAERVLAYLKPVSQTDIHGLLLIALAVFQPPALEFSHCDIKWGRSSEMAARMAGHMISGEFSYSTFLAKLRDKLVSPVYGEESLKAAAASTYTQDVAYFPQGICFWVNTTRLVRKLLNDVLRKLPGSMADELREKAERLAADLTREDSDALLLNLRAPMQKFGRPIVEHEMLSIEKPAVVATEPEGAVAAVSASRACAG